ncbi:MAG: hypothetical protein HY720_01640 [Planctomycetes bacterium]|nr:hypothetical protein [Planctomycetota bacterium]
MVWTELVGAIGGLVGLLGVVIGMVSNVRSMRTRRDLDTLQRKQVLQLGSARLDPELSYRLEQCRDGSFAILRIVMEEKGVSRVQLVGLSADLRVLETPQSDLEVNGKKMLSLRTGQCVHERSNRGLHAHAEEIDEFSILPGDENRFWRGLFGSYDYGRKREVEMPLKVKGSGLFAVDISFIVQEVATGGDDFIVQELATEGAADGPREPIQVWAFGGETMICAIPGA